MSGRRPQTRACSGTCGRVLIVLGAISTLGAVSRASDWPLKGGHPDRNAVSRTSAAWLGDTRTHRAGWTAALGTSTLGDPVISQGLVWVGSNNERPRDPADRSDSTALMCFRERDGKFLYQYLSPRLKVPDEDWAQAGLSSSPVAETDRVWFLNNRAEVICLDVAPLVRHEQPPHVLWKIDLRQWGVQPRGVLGLSHLQQSSLVASGELLFVNTGHAPLPGQTATRAPSLVALQKTDGKIRWTDESPGAGLTGLQQGCPVIAEHDGQTLVIQGQGDGWLRAFDAETGAPRWQFDLTTTSDRRAFRTGENPLAAMPVFHAGHVYVTIGAPLEVGDGPGRLCCLAIDGRGDISSELRDGQKNPNSGLKWEYRAATSGQPLLHRSLSAAVVSEGCVFAADATGWIHAVDAATGSGLWTHDAGSRILANPLLVDSHLLVCTETDLLILAATRDKRPIGTHPLAEPIAASPVFANNTLYLAQQRTLITIHPPLLDK